MVGNIRIGRYLGHKAKVGLVSGHVVLIIARIGLPRKKIYDVDFVRGMVPK